MAVIGRSRRVRTSDPELIEVSPREYKDARRAALNELGLSYRQLKAQARTGEFSSLRARKLWLAIGQHQ